MKALLHHSEITIKGKNSGFYEKKLLENTQKLFARKNIPAKVEKDTRRLLCSFDDKYEGQATKLLKKVLGIRHYSLPKMLEKDMDVLLKEVENILKKMSSEGVKTLSIETQRSDKKFPFNTPQINKEIGRIANENNIKIDYENGEKTLFVEITYNQIYIYFENFDAYGGLPVSSSGKVLCLFSGGIDSAVAAWLMMRRGCKVDFLHFHTFRENKAVLDTKIKNIIEILNDYQFSSRLYLVPYHKYQIKTTSAQQHLDLVLFRNFMLRFARRLASRYSYRAIITGDSLAQVASQTLLNLSAASHDTRYLLLRPLIAYTKEEIIERAKEIGTFEESIKEYKDCCSIISQNPDTNVKITHLKEALSDINMLEIVKECFKDMEKFNIQ